MRKWLLLLILALGLAWPTAAQAQDTVTLSKMELDLWPEYDKPSMLVIYHLFLAPGTTLPANVSLHIPASAGDPYNLAVRETDGQLYNLAHSRTVQGDQAVISFTTPGQEIQFEYYDPQLTRNGSTRSYTYRWPGDYAIAALTIQVQQPIGATGMQISPSLGTGLSGDGGVVYYTGIEGAIQAGQTFNVKLSYQKDNDKLSVEALQVVPSTPISDNTVGRSPTPKDVLPWIFGGLGVLLVAGGVFWYIRAGQEESSGGRKRHVSKRVNGELLAASDDSLYCHECGKRAVPGDLFCRACGTRLRGN